MRPAGDRTGSGGGDIRRLQGADAPVVAALARRCLYEVNAADYPREVIESLAAKYTPEYVAARAAQREMYVFADSDGNAVGTITVDDGEVSGLWVNPDRQRGGVGRALLAHAERLAAQRGHERMTLAASLTAVGFYEGLGYALTDRRSNADGSETLTMTKTLT